MNSSKEKGFTLVEVVIAIVIVALVFTASLMLLTGGRNMIMRGNNRNNLAICEKSLLDEASLDMSYFQSTYLKDDYKVADSLTDYRLNYSDAYQTLTDHDTHHYIILSCVKDTTHSGYTSYAITLQGYYQGSKLGSALEREVRVYA